MKLRSYPLALLFAAVCQSASAQYISNFAGNGSSVGSATGAYSGDGWLAIHAQLNQCAGVAVDGAGNIYIADKGNNVVRRVNTSGIITTFAGTGTVGASGNGGQATAARLNGPVAVATDAAGNVYITDNGNNAIRKVNTAGFITAYAGVGSAGYSGDGASALAAELKAPEGITIDALGNLYIADAGNNVVRKVDTAHNITTVAGTGTAGKSGDGGAAIAAKLSQPTGVATDQYGNLYIADNANHSIRKVTAAGIITTIAGTGLAGNSGDGGPAVSATLRYPSSVSVDGSSNIYIADQGNNNVRVINAAGAISHYAGTSTAGYSGNGGLAATATLSSPRNVLADGWGRVYVTDYGNHGVRVVTATPIVGVQHTVGAATLNIFPNPAKGAFTVELPGNTTAQVTVTDITGRLLQTQEVNSKTATIRALTPGHYTVTVKTGEQTVTGKVVVE